MYYVNTDGHTASVGEQEKIKYHDGALGSSWAFVPFVQESFGRFGVKTQQFIKKLAQHSAMCSGGNGAQIKSRFAFAKKQIVATLSRSLAQELAERVHAVRAEDEDRTPFIASTQPDLQMDRMALSARVMGHMAATRATGGFGDYVGEGFGGGEELDWDGMQVAASPAWWPTPTQRPSVKPAACCAKIINPDANTCNHDVEDQSLSAAVPAAGDGARLQPTTDTRTLSWGFAAPLRRQLLGGSGAEEQEQKQEQGAAGGRSSQQGFQCAAGDTGG
ncbi:hypothetical protein JKP88DRAFT_280743 [Tribonema minus]|uniref:Uncharacterized protein n=1 Tax=Tribonema minus TaxID=303371 RepID=A0A835YP37_9STRA|nr:hypothetical protein JKP88DRAFT_280743 [Tribonema minus]